MPISIINSFASWWFKKRLSDLNLFAHNPLDTQREQFILLIDRAVNTEYGKKFNFARIHTYEDFQENVSLSTYKDLFPYIDRMMRGESDVLWPGKARWFAKSSGTTSSKSKFIPVMEETLEFNHFQGGKDVVTYYYNNYPDTELLKGKILKVGGSKELQKLNDIYIGDLSAIMIDNMPFWANIISFPEKNTALIANWEEKIDRIIDESLDVNITGMAGIPSWIMLLLKRALEKTGKQNIFEIWPNLEAFFHGGVSFVPYRDEFSKLLPKKDFHYQEIYNASEGFFALQDRKESDELLLMLNHGIFYEFIPMDQYAGVDSQEILRLKDVEIGRNYALVISTNSGLWRYIIGDTVEFTSTKPYRIKITGRTKHFINVFGEEVVIGNTDQAIEFASRETRSNVLEYTVAPIFMSASQKGGHEWMIEFDKEPDDFERFKVILDQRLKELNSDYEIKRYQNFTLDFPSIHRARKNLFYDWLKQKNKLGGQNKVPRLLNSRTFMEELLALNEF